MKKPEIADNITWIGCNDPTLDIFESQYKLNNGMAYNSYLVKGNDAIAIMDTMDQRKVDEWLEKLEKELNGQKPDYLIISHMEPDHSSAITEVVKRYPDIKLVATPLAFKMLPHYHDIKAEQITVKDNDTIDLGGKTLQFLTAPLVHWPEVMMTYVPEDKVLFSADGFGKFGTTDTEEEWEPEAARYYFNIVGKFGPQVQAILKKAGKLDIETIASLHGPVLTEDIGKYIQLYDTWSKYEPEIDGIVIAVTSVYGNTLKTAQKLQEILEDMGANVILRDLSHHDEHQVMADCFRYSKTVFCSTSYNGGLFPVMENLLTTLAHKAWQNRTVGLIENGSWAPSAARTMEKVLTENFKNITIIKPAVTIWGKYKESDQAKLETLAKELVQ